MCKQSMLVWVNAVLPGKNITNFTTDWTSGENLAALINFCKPGLVSIYAHPYEQLSQAMQVAQKAFNVPPVLSPDDLFVDQPDEVSVMVYLSYFCRIGSPGERALLQWVQQVIPSQNITNLTTDWVSGVNLGALVHKLTHSGFPQFKKFTSTTPLANTQESMKKAEELVKIPPSVSADSLSSNEVGYLTKLAYLVQFYAAHKGEPVVLKGDISKVQVSPINQGEDKGSRVVWIDVDCSNAGTAEIKAVANTEAGKEIDISVNEMTDGEEKYRIQYAVEEGVDIYTVSITYGGQEVSGSPFHVNLADADANKVQPLGTETSTEWEESKSVILGFDTKEAGYGKLTAKASGESAGFVPIQLVPKPLGGFDVVFHPPIPDIYMVDVQWGKFMALATGHSCGTIPIEFQQDSKRDFKLAFEPPTPDVYTVDVMWGGEPVPGSPFTINLLPPAQPDKVESGDPVFGGVGENVDLPVDLTHAGPGVLTTTCTGGKVGKVETTVITISKKVYQVTFLASQMDTYHLSVLFNEFHIPGSPFCIDLLQKRRRASVPQPTVMREIGLPTIIEVPTNDGSKKSKIIATVFGDVTGPHGAVVKKNARGSYEVMFDPKVPDIYTIDIQMNDVRVPECCFVVSYISSPLKKCRILTDLVELQKIFDTNYDVQLAVSTAGAGKGSLEARVESPDGEEYDVVVKPREDEDSIYDISYVPKVTGTHYMKITWEGNDISQTPLPIRVTDFAKVMTVSHGKSISLSVNVPNTAKENDIKANVIHVASGGITKYTGRYYKGKYHITFSPKKPGLYSVMVFIKDRELPSCPQVVRSGDPPNPQKCIIKEYPGSAFVGGELTFTIDASSAGSGELNIRATTHSMVLIRRKSKVAWKEVAGTPGVYTVTFTPTTTGQHSMHITWAGRNIPGSPYRITVLEKPSLDYPAKPTAEVYVMDVAGTPTKVDPIPEVLNCCIGQTLLLRVKLVSKHEGALTLIGKGLKSIISEEPRMAATGERIGLVRLHVKKSSDNYYYAEFAPTEEDRYVVSVQCYNEEVVNSPITALFEHPQSDPSKVQILEMNGNDCYIEQEFKLELLTKGAGLGPLKVSAVVPGGEERIPVSSVKEEGKEKCIVQYFPQTIGKHALHLLWGDTAIPHSPLIIEVNELPVIPSGQEGFHAIPVAKLKLSEIQSVGTHLDTGATYAVKRKQKKNKYVFSLQPDQQGTYEIALSVKGREICRPFRFKYERPSRPENVVVFDINREVTVNEVLQFKIDVSDAGDGPLKIETLKGSKRAETKITSFKDGIYTVSSSSSSAGRYSLKIMWGEEEILGSPFVITVSSVNEIDSGSDSGSVKTSNDEVKEVLVKEVASTDIIIRRPFSWIINLTEHEGKLEVTAVGDKTGPVEVLLIQVQERVYRATFRPTKSDRYTIYILVNGKHVADSPRNIICEVPQQNVNKIKIDGRNKISSLLAVGQTIHFVVNTQDAGLGELKVNPKPPKSKTETYSIEIDEHDDNPAIYTVSYTPLIVGVHSLELLFSRIPIPGTPVQLTVCDPQAVLFTHASQTLVKIGQSIKMEVDTSKAGSDELTATCSGTNCGEVSVSVSKTKAKGKLEICFKPLIEDLYTLVVKLGTHHVKGSPFKFNLCSIPIEKTIVTGPQLPERPGGQIELNIDTSGLPKGKLESHCKYDEQTISVKVKEMSPNVFSLAFEPEEPALYFWSVLFHGQHVPGSPFQIDTRPHADKAVVVAPEMGSVRIGQYVYYEIDMSGAGMGTLTATCRGEISKKIPVQITKVRQGVYRVSFLPLSFDTYTLYIQWSGIELPNSPFAFDLKPPLDIAKDPIDIPLKTPRIEDPSALKVTCTGQKYGVIAVNLIPISTNNYRISFKPQGPDLYTISVFYNSKHIKGSPFNLDLRVPERKAKHKDITINSEKSGKSSEHNAVIGTAFIVSIKGKESKESSRILATAVGLKTGETAIHVDQYSRRVAFNPKSADTYTLNISLNGDPVPQSPFIVHYSDPPSDPSRVNIIGLEDILSVLDIHKEVSLVINATKGGNGTLRAELKGPKEVKADVKARDGEPGTYTVSFIPTAAGLYILSLFWNKEHIPKSPLKIRVVDTSTSVKTLLGKKVTSNDMEIRFGPTDIQAYALRRDSTKKLKVTVKQIKTHLYRFIFSHKEPGHYFIHIFVNGEELDVSPIPVYITQPSWPRKCRVHNLPSVGYVNEEISIIINCKEGGEGTLEAKVIEPNKSESSLALVDNKDGTFNIVYLPTTEGTCTFIITWSGQEISGSPYKITVKKPTEYELPVTNVSVVDLIGKSTSFTGGNQASTSMNCYFEFGIRLKKKQAKIFIARAFSENGSYFDFSLIKTTGDLFKYSFKPPSPGKYMLKFSLGDHTLTLPQLPSILFFTEAEVDSRKINVLTHTISGLLLIDRQILFQIDTRLAGNGKITACLEGPSSDVPDVRIAPTPDTPHFYDVFFTPVVAGSYHLELLWGGTMVPGFPLVLHVTEPTIKYGESSSFEIQIDSHAKYISSFASHVETGERYKVEIYQVSKRRYQFKFNPKISGKYNLHVLVNGKDISGSPFQLTYDHPPQAENVTITKLPKKIQVGSEVEFFINTQRAGNGHLNIKITGPVPVEIQLTEHSPGIYKAEFTPSTAGAYKIKITWSGEEVPNSPFELKVTDFYLGVQDLYIPPVIDGPSISPDFPLSPPHDLLPSIIESDLNIFRKKHTLGKLSFSIIHNGFPDKLNIRFTGSTELPFKVIKGQRANKYEIDPKTGGKYEMVILWGGSVVGEVYTLHFELPKTITGFNIQDQVFQVGKSYQFAITTDDISTGVIEISCVPRDAADIVCKAVTSTQYQCSLVPKTVGDVNIAVSYNGFQIQGSPFVVHFKAATAFNCKFGFQSEGIEINDISAVLESIATQQPIPLSLQQLFGGECNLDFVPTEGDEYKLTITCGLKIKREMMAGSPFTLTYLTGQGGASMCRIEGGISGGVVGKWSKFVVNSEGAGSGKLTAEISGEGAEVKVVSLSEYVYEVNCDVCAGGEYQLKLLWGGQDIPGSPLTISAEQNPSIRLDIPSQVELTENIDIDCEIKVERSEDLTFEATTESGRKISGYVAPSEQGFHVSIPTSEPGEYSIAVYYKGRSILPTPSKVRVGPTQSVHLQSQQPIFEETFPPEIQEYTEATNEDTIDTGKEVLQC